MTSPSPARPGDVKHSYASIEAARKGLGYEPATTLQGGLSRMVNGTKHSAT